MNAADADRVDRQLAGLTASHRGLLAMLGNLLAGGALDAAAPSRLPGWTVGHVLAHLARNADSITRVLEASERGEVAERYPGGAAGREEGIEAGASRPAPEQVADVRATIERLDAALTVHTRWDGTSIESNGEALTVAELVVARWREVEVHRTDLGLGYDPADWPVAYVLTDLPALEARWRSRRGVALPAAARAADDRTRLAWLLGRVDIDGVEPARVM